jgi:hypothetical protein
VAVAPDGTAVVVWARWDGANFRIQERRLASGGAPEEATRTLSGSGQDAADPQVDVGPDGTATVVWRRFDGFHPLVQVRRIAPDGTSEEAAQRLSEAGQDAVEPQVELGPGGEATVAWTRFDGANWVIQGRRLSAAGTTEGAVLGLSPTGRDAAEPQLAIDPAGLATVAWDRFDGSSFVVQARRIDAGGALLGGSVNLSATGRDAADPQVAAAPAGGATVLWSRNDGSNWVVQRRDLGADGSLGATVALSAGGRGAGDAVAAWGEDGTLAMLWRRFASAGDVVQANTVPKPEPPPPPPDPEEEENGDGSSAGSEAGTGSGGGPDATAPVDNSFKLGKARLDRRRGTATLAVEVPGPGLVAVDGAVPRQQRADGPGRVTLRILPRPKARQILNRRGSVRLRLTVTFVPSGGEPGSRAVSLRLKKELGG